VVATLACHHFLHARLRVQRASGIPHALYWARDFEQLGRFASRGCEGVSGTILLWHIVQDARARKRGCTAGISRSLWMRLASRMRKRALRLIIAHGEAERSAARTMVVRETLRRNAFSCAHLQEGG
jgi:hypothetical protein